MPDPATAHDARVLGDLVAEVERSLQALETGATLPPALRDQALARRGAVDELRAAGANREAGASGDGLLEKAQRALERFAGDAGDPGSAAGPASSADAGALRRLEAEEDALQRRFEAALADDALSGPARDAVLRAYDRVKPGHDAVRQAALAARGEV